MAKASYTTDHASRGIVQIPLWYSDQKFGNQTCLGYFHTKQRNKSGI